MRITRYIVMLCGLALVGVMGMTDAAEAAGAARAGAVSTRARVTDAVRLTDTEMEQVTGGDAWYQVVCSAADVGSALGAANKYLAYACAIVSAMGLAGDAEEVIAAQFNTYWGEWINYQFAQASMYGVEVSVGCNNGYTGNDGTCGNYGWFYSQITDYGGGGDGCPGGPGCDCSSDDDCYYSSCMRETFMCDATIQ